MAKAKFYVVKRGRIPGIYKTWPECEAQIKNYPNAIHKSFKNYQDAINFLNNSQTCGQRSLNNDDYDNVQNCKYEFQVKGTV